VSLSWSKNGLVSALKPMDWQFREPASGAQMDAYLQMYRLDFPELSGVRHFAGLIQAADYQIAVQVWRPQNPRGTAIVVHGYYDHVGLYGSLIGFCLQQGLNVVTFDLPGHGLSSGESASIGSFQEYDEVFSLILQRTRGGLGGPLYVFGQSTGGAIIINYLLKRQLTKAQSPFAGITLMAPLVRPKGWYRGRLVHTFVSLFLRQVRRKFNPNSADTDFLRFIAEEDPLQPHHLSVRWVGALKQWIPYIEALPASELAVTIVQGDNDNTVAWRHNLKLLAQKFPRQRLMMLPGGQHHLVNESPQHREQIYRQLAEWLLSDSNPV